MRLEGRAFSGKRVIVTGHTGFKAAWLSEWLLALGARVYGYSLPAPTREAARAIMSFAAGRSYDDYCRN